MNILRLANAAGKMGYFFAALQWLVVFAFYFTWIATYFIEPMQPSSQTEVVIVTPATPKDSSGVSPLLIVTAGVIVLIMVALTIYALWRMPKAVSNASRKVVQGAAKKTAPFALQVQHKPKTRTAVIRLEARFIAAGKCIVIFLPVLLAWLTQYIAPSVQVLPPSLALIIAVWCALPTLMFFAVQYCIALLCKLPLKKIL